MAFVVMVTEGMELAHHDLGGGALADDRVRVAVVFRESNETLRSVPFLKKYLQSTIRISF